MLMMIVAGEWSEPWRTMLEYGVKAGVLVPIVLMTAFFIYANTGTRKDRHY